MAKTPLGLLQQLARLYGVQTSYYDAFRQRRQATPEALLLVLRALGAPIETLSDVPAAIRERQQSLWQRDLEPVQVAWDGRAVHLELHLPENRASSAVACHLTLETGDVRSWLGDLAELSTPQSVELEGARYVTKRLTLPGGLPWGYHRLALEMPGKLLESLVVSAPLRAFTSAGGQQERMWGVLLPLYALHSQRSWGGGDLSDLEALMEWTAGLGGDVVATLPLLTAFLDEPFDPSPYAPASRLFWNEFYLDVGHLPELESCPTARTILESTEVQREIEALRSDPLVDHRRQMAIKRRVLEETARCFFAQRSERHAKFQGYLEADAAVEEYAGFRAAGERQRASWPQWPQPMQDGILQPGDYDEDTKRYHLYTQWLAHEQMVTLSEAARAKGLRLYLDLPLGAPLHSYDVWRHRDAFAVDVTAGAPPDRFFTKGQEWGLPPLHPERIREQRHHYFIACLRHHLQHASVLRLDHVMGLHRLFWVPKGLEAREGIYVRYPAQELYAILSLESHRHQAVIVGEDLGTVPRAVRSAMGRHRVQRMYVLPYQLIPDPLHTLPAVPADSVASLNTHDMSPFGGFWQGLDIQDRIELGLLEEADAGIEWENRQALKQALITFLGREGWLKGDADAPAVLRACLEYLSISPARLVLINLEDLWLETQRQNTPGTWAERPNWRRKAQYSREVFSQMPQVLETLREVDYLRKARRDLG